MEMEIQLPCKKGNFEMLKILGKGKFGEVYLARYENTNQFFAIKKVNRKQVEKNPKAMEYFETETRLMSEFNHPNLMKVLSLMITSNSFYVVLEFCNSGCLNSKIREVDSKDDYIPERTCLIYLFQIIAGITEMHSRKILHRDIKPDNILFHGDTIKIGDFGMVKLYENDDLVTKVGTPLYQAPEIMCTDHGTIYTSAVDIWSIGVTFFKMLYKNHPWKALDGSSSITRAELKIAVQKQSGINLMFPSFPQVSPNTKDLLRRMIEPKPDKRITLYEIIMHPAFQFMQSENPSAADASLSLQQKAKKIMNDLQSKPEDFYKKLNFDMRDGPDSNNYRPGTQQSELNDLAASLKIPGPDPNKEFTERLENERFYITCMNKWSNQMSGYLATITPQTNTFWVGILWSLIYLSKKAETYSLNLYTNLQNKVNIFNIEGFDQQVKNSNGYGAELANLHHCVSIAQNELYRTLEMASKFRPHFEKLPARSRDTLVQMHDGNINFCRTQHKPEAVQQKLSDSIIMVCQVYFKNRRRVMNLDEIPSTTTWIVLLDILQLNEIESVITNGEAFSRDQFFAMLQNEREISDRIEIMAQTRYQQFAN